MYLYFIGHLILCLTVRGQQMEIKECFLFSREIIAF